MAKRGVTMEKYYCMKCKVSVWMRETLDKNDSQQDAWKCIICGTVHAHPNLWKKPPATIA
jgi:DNA-directed RNA polymerase subunit RPC12/RpoP